MILSSAIVSGILETGSTYYAMGQRATEPGVTPTTPPDTATATEPGVTPTTPPDTATATEPGVTPTTPPDTATATEPGVTPTTPPDTATATSTATEPRVTPTTPPAAHRNHFSDNYYNNFNLFFHQGRFSHIDDNNKYDYRYTGSTLN